MVQPQGHLERPQGPHSGQGRNRQLATKVVGESIPRLPVKTHLAHREVGSVVHLALQAVGLLFLVFRRRVDGHSDEESGGITNPIAGTVEALGHPRQRPNELEDVDVIHIVHTGEIS